MGARLCTFRGVWIVDSVGVRGSAVAFEQVVRGGVPPRGCLVNVDGCGQRVSQGGGTGQSGATVCDVLHIVGRVVARFHSCRGRFPTDPPGVSLPFPRRVPAVPPACPCRSPGLSPADPSASPEGWSARVQRHEVRREPGQVHVGDGSRSPGADGDPPEDVLEMVVACINVRIDLLAGLADRVGELAPVGIAEDVLAIGLTCASVRVGAVSARVESFPEPISNRPITFLGGVLVAHGDGGGGVSQALH